MRRGRPLVIDWTDTAEELATLLQQERHHHRRTRLMALLMLREGKRIGEVCDALDIHYRTVQRWADWYRTGGVDAVLQRTPGHNALGRPPKLNTAQTRALLKEYESGAFKSINDAVEWTARRYGVGFTYNGMLALLRRAQERFSSPHPYRHPVRPTVKS